MLTERLMQQPPPRSPDAFSLSSRSCECTAPRGLLSAFAACSLMLLLVAGLGRRASEVNFTGSRGVHALNCGPHPPSPHIGKPYADVGALDNFWRSAENLHVDGLMRWATSQAAPLRKVHALALTFSDGDGWSSGGFAANIRIGSINYGTQQQTFVRNAEWREITGFPSLNTVGVGTIPSLEDRCDSTSVLGVAETPRIAEKPYLISATEGSHTLALVIPTLRCHARGVDLSDESATEIPLSDSSRVYVATDRDAALTINEHLAAGKHVLLSPGMYAVDEPLRVNTSGQVLLGLGFATLTPTRGNAAVEVTAAGARLSGVMVQAGALESDVLVRIGLPRHEHEGEHEGASRAAHWSSLYVDDPIVVHDLFVRVYAERSAAQQARAGTMVHIHADHTIVDHAWLWRADHDSEGHFKNRENPVDTALEVDGAKVIIYALFAEHTLSDLVRWRGEDGSLFFYQSELAYDAPTGWDAPAYNVTASRHTALGVGVYSYFFANVSVTAGVVTPPGATSHGVTLRNAFTHFLDGRGSIRHVINREGQPVTKTGQSSYVCRS
mmetsp:Transcript_47549/g.110287  ORF Transcript_47549/g.110287 Transcript_47549/m.110287 type:complete len:554 (-) Transcript_47549:128-1789(-)